MKNKKLIITIILLSLSLIGFIIYELLTTEEKYFKHFSLGNENTIINTIENKPYLDTIAHIYLSYLGIDSTLLILKELEKGFTSKNMEDVDIKAKIQNKGKQYIIWISNVSKEEAIKILSHEFVHFNQYYTKRLKIDSKEIYWEGKLFNHFEYSYKNYPWEIEAFSLQNTYYKDVLTILY